MLQQLLHQRQLPHFVTCVVWLNGSLFSFETDAMIEAIFAGWKMPPPIPYRNNTLANRYGDHCASIKLKPTNAINITPKPMLINKVVPKRPMNFPDILEKITRPSGADSKTKPVCKGVNDVKFCKNMEGR